MNPEYGDIFSLRGHSYHAAMDRFPNARTQEFSGLFERFPLSLGETILDLPAGGGYLADSLKGLAHVTSLELTSGFGAGVSVVAPAAHNLPAGLDRAVCLAALHHIADPIEFLTALRTAVRAGGLLHVADVADGSPLCKFLDGFVARYNVTGHRGRYLPEDAAFFSVLGTVTYCQEVPCPWVFGDESEMLQFCSGLFGLVDCPPAELRAALSDLVGIREDEGGIVLDWRLLYVDIVTK